MKLTEKMLASLMNETNETLLNRIKITTPMVNGYLRNLISYDYPVVAHAFRRCEREEIYYPTVAVLIAIIEEITLSGKQILETDAYLQQLPIPCKKEYSSEQEKNRDERRLARRDRESRQTDNHEWDQIKMEEMEDAYLYPEDRIFTGFPKLDRFTDGFGKGEYIVIGARPSTGKSAITTSITAYNRSEGKNIVVFVLESTIDNYMNRLNAISTGYPVRGFRKGYLVKDIDILRDISMTFEKRIVSENKIFFSKENKIDKMLSEIEEYVFKEKCELIIVDHIGKIMAGMQGNDNQQLSHVSNSLSKIASRLDTTVIVNSQLSRSGKERADKFPLLTDLRSSGSLEQDADVVLLLHRAQNEPHDTTIEIAKNRDGRKGRIQFYFDGETVSFKETEI
ncbi:MAG: DnaB-like helicase C-terminal domain-containing protein [Candidatus Omnitrophota bacterium]